LHDTQFLEVFNSILFIVVATSAKCPTWHHIKCHENYLIHRIGTALSRSRFNVGIGFQFELGFVPSRVRFTHGIQKST